MEKKLIVEGMMCNHCKASVEKVLNAAGSLLGAVPALLRQFLRKKPRPPRVPFPWQRCLRGFLCGLALALALGLAGDGRILPALLTGSAGGYGFCLAALISGFITVRIMGRARA